MPTQILVVDDIESNLFALEALLQGDSYKLVRARSGAEALSALRHGDFALILLDVQMPEMDGFDTADAIRRDEAGRRTPIIFVTAFGSSEEKLSRAYAVGALDFLTKPIDPDALRAKVQVVADLMGRIETTKLDVEARHEQRLRDERRRWETESLRARVAEQEQLACDANAARVEAEKANKLKDEFLATLSHELRTPLNAVLGWASILKMRGPDHAYLKRGLDVIERNAKAQAKLIEDMLDISRIIAGKLRLERQRVSLSELVERAVEAMRPSAEQKGVAMVADVGGSVRPIYGDPERLRQIVANLLSNAVKFTAKGGRVSVQLTEDAESARIAVRDTGVGIASEFLPRVFDRFRQVDGGTARPHGGLGIGLALARHLAELHGGTIEAESGGLGAGAAFTIVLPSRGGKKEPPLATEAVSPATSLEGLRVLIVDDEADARDLSSEVFTTAGAVVATAASAAEAIAALSWRPQVIVSDIGMPGEDGYALMRRIRGILGPSSGDWLPAIALTAYASLDDVAEAHAAGFQAHVAKPVLPAELLGAVAAIVRTEK